MPNRAEPHNNLGLVYEAAEKLPEALEHYEVALTMDSRNPEYLGNLARLRLKMNERDPTVRRLLEELVFYDSRPVWVAWAQEQLGVFLVDNDEPAQDDDSLRIDVSPKMEELIPPEPVSFNNRLSRHRVVSQFGGDAQFDSAPRMMRLPPVANWQMLSESSDSKTELPSSHIPNAGDSSGVITASFQMDTNAQRQR